jgi:hypothetical protein
MANEIADQRVAVTPSLLEEIRDWAEITDLKQHEVLSWLIKEAKVQIEATRPEVIEAYENLQEYKSRHKIKVAI